jgi:hypothetical protein
MIEGIPRRDTGAGRDRVPLRMKMDEAGEENKESSLIVSRGAIWPMNDGMVAD